MSDEYRFRVSNPVIAKDDVGRAKHSTYSLPPDTHAYGRALPRDPEGAREVLSLWVPHHPTAAPQDLAQDFRAINKCAAKKGVRTVKQMSAFRRAVDIRLNPRLPEGVAPGHRGTPRDAKATYGRANLPSTPMQDVLKGAFATEFQSELSARYDAYAELDAVGPNGKHRIRTTKAQSLRVHSARQRSADPKPTKPVRDPFRLVSQRPLMPLTAREARSASTAVAEEPVEA
mmetsp:Transcript_21164/g.49255  ORF Transcript_21164/g.49255 Transcript_21164/m.49255 type:complete len:230 (+) Transcript_21164:75-764(+)